MRQWWRVVALALTLGGSRCSCDPPCSNHEPAAHASVQLQQGCFGYECALVCEAGWADCDGNIDSGCETSTTQIPAHTTLDTSDTPESGGGGCGGTSSNTIGTIGSCKINCDPGFFDCDNDTSNGCETSSVVGCFDASLKEAGEAGEPTTAHRIATLSAAPRGLVACGVVEAFFDGADLYVINTSSLSMDHVALSPSLPADGLACDGPYLYWTTLADADAATPNSVLYRARVTGGALEVVESGFDARSGIDLRDGGVFVMTSSGLVVSSGIDAGLAAWMPALPTSAYKPFTLGPSEDWSLDDATIVRRASDAAAASWIDDAGSPSAVVTVAGEPIVVRHTSFDDAGPTADDLAFLRDDAGDATLQSFATVHPIVATTSASRTIVASDDTIYLVITPSSEATIYTTPDHIVDVAVDGTWVVWTTRGQGKSAPGVWRGKIP